MSISVAQPEVKVPDGISAEEWAVRCDLAAAYQLIDLYGMSDLTGTHISARVPGPDDLFYLNPLGILFDQITASSLITVDLDGNIVDGDADMNFAGFVIHSAVHMAKPELTSALHTHTVANNAVAAMQEGLLPMTQKALLNLSFVKYHDYEGGALDVDERQRIVRDLGDDGRIVLLRNHGALTVGSSVAEAWVFMYRLEMACRMQVAAMSCAAGGMTPIELSPEVILHTMEQGRKALSPGGAFEAGTQEWPSLLRKLERERGTSYRT